MVFRGSDVSNMDFVGFVSGSQNSYSDLTPPEGTSTYQVRVVAPICDPISNNPLQNLTEQSDTLKSNVVEHEYVEDNNDLGVNIITNNPTCPTCNNGNAIAFPFDGSAPYTIYWSNGIPSGYNGSLSAGDYTVYISDSEGNFISETITLTAPAGDIDGCIDQAATNYNPDATQDDGSCEYDEPAACVNPSNVWTQNVVHTRATIKWTDMNADRYLIKGNGVLLVAMGTVGDGIEAGVQKTTFNVQPGTTYELTMRTFCMDGTSTGWEDVGSFTTLPECVNPEVFSMNFVESEWAELSWDHAGNASGENMYMGELRNVTQDSNWGLFAGMISSNPGVDQPTNLKLKAGLVGGNDYEYRIKTWCNTGDENNPTDPFYRADGFGPAIGSFTTIPCAIQTENLTVDYNSSNANGANHAFGWDVNLSTEGVADRYLIQFTVVGAGNWQNRTVSGGGTATGRNIGGFAVGTEYNWRARTICSTDPTSARWRSDWAYGPSFVAGDGARLASSPVTQLDVYPNPSRDVFNVMFNSQEVQTITVKVVNVIGETIYQEDLKDFTGQYTKAIDLRSQAKGVYTLQITTPTGGINKKIVLQ